MWPTQYPVHFVGSSYGSRDSSVTRLRAGRFGIQVPRGTRGFSIIQTVLTLSGAQWVPGCFHGEGSKTGEA